MKKDKKIEVSKNLGFSAQESFFKIILPSARPAIVAGLSLVAMGTTAKIYKIITN